MAIWSLAVAGLPRTFRAEQTSALAQSNRLAEYLQYLIAAALLWLLRVLPLRGATVVARAATGLLDRALPKLRRIAHTNLAFAFPEKSFVERAQVIDGVFQSIARLLVGLARFPTLNGSNISDWVGYEGLENYQAAKTRGRGVLIATAHLGNWELSAFAHALLTEPMSVMVRPLDNPWIDRLVEERRALSGNTLIQKRDAARVVLKALKSNAPIGILIDQNTTPAEGVFIDFFGKKACASSAFVKLAYHSGAAVVPGFALWHLEDQRYRIHFLPEVPLSGSASDDTQRIHSILEAAIRRHPDQWLWIHRRWKTRPPGEAPLY